MRQKGRSHFTYVRSPSTIILTNNELKSESPHPLEAMVQAGSTLQLVQNPKRAAD
ncbi:MAG: hypothetical protein QQW96_05425 [Tychonema bourrellyi B0820]|uniref:hypothetical protein n=1 Tax=Tychonema bourrellyi TaxID=54313 RepID=UPI0015D49F7F|nr:hypothetical protein [Tychonema bourrellyi]MDQ2097072.1 hypothetical protein [Tychonema bourrellyi B0820]